MEIHIRKAAAGDAKAVADILNFAIKAGVSVIDGPLTEKKEGEYIRNFPKDGVFAIAESNDGVVTGFQVLEHYYSGYKAFEHVATIGTFVHPKLRRNGIGLALTKFTIAEAMKLGYKKILTTVLRKNCPALAFYKKMGFSEVGIAKSHACLKGKYYDEVFIEKLL